MYAVIIGVDKYINKYREYLQTLNIDLSNVLQPKEFSPLATDIYNHYLLKRADVVIVITEDDQFNFYICKLCKEWYKIEKVITSINNPNNREVFASIGIEEVIDINDYTKQILNKFLIKRSN